jgi:hypothetical protein
MTSVETHILCRVRLPLLLLFVCSWWLLPQSDARRTLAAPGLPIRAVNLGGWLLTEGWILPSLFDGIPNKDLLVGTFLAVNASNRESHGERAKLDRDRHPTRVHWHYIDDVNYSYYC